MIWVWLRLSITSQLPSLLALEGNTRAAAEQRMLEKLTRSLTEDIPLLLPAGVRFNDDDAVAAFGRVWTELVVRLKGDGWKLTDKVIAECQSEGQEAPASTIKVRHHTPGYAPISESISWGKFGAIYPPIHAFSRQNRALSQIGVPSPKCYKYREK